MSQDELPTSHSSPNLTVTDRTRGCWPLPGEVPRACSSASQRSLTPSYSPRSPKSPRSPRSPRSPGTPRSQRKELCDDCERVVLERGDEPPSGHIIPLGLFKEVEHRKDYCALCKLVYRLLSQAGSTRSHFDHKVTLSLKPSTEDIAVLCSEVAHTAVQDVPRTDIRGWIRMVAPSPSTSSSFASIESEISLLSLSDTGSRRGAQSNNSLSARIWRSKQIDPLQIRSWLQECETQHDESCNRTQPGTNRTRGRRLVDLLLIDVDEKKLVYAEPGARFAALSYVWGQWGGHDVTHASNSNIGFLLTGGALNRIRPPTVVRDAMDFVRQIGLKYLWCDLFCIVQDNVALRDQQISQMDVIYSEAYLTIVALTGEHGNNELPGVQKKTTRRPICLLTEIGNGTKFIGRAPCLDVIRTPSIYEHRGWTYQEQLMSGRCIYLTDRQAYFRCRSGSHREDEQLCSYGGFNLRESRMLHSPPTDIVTRLSESSGFSLYDEFIREYTGRGLSKDSDILKAFDAIIKTLTGAYGNEFVCGLPSTYFDQALLWNPSSHIRYRFWDVNTRQPRRRHFMDDHELERTPPTWSWAAWKGQVQHLRSASMQDGTNSASESHFLQSCISDFGVMTSEALLPVNRFKQRITSYFNWRSEPRRSALTGFDYYALDYIRTAVSLVKKLFFLLADRPDGRWAKDSHHPNHDWPWEDDLARSAMADMGLDDWTHLTVPTGAQLFEAYSVTESNAYIEQKQLPPWPFKSTRTPEMGKVGPRFPKPFPYVPHFEELDCALQKIPYSLDAGLLEMRPNALCFWAHRKPFHLSRLRLGQLYLKDSQSSRMTTADGRWSCILPTLEFGTNGRKVDTCHEHREPATIIFSEHRRRPCGIIFEREIDCVWRVTRQEAIRQECFLILLSRMRMMKQSRSDTRWDMFNVMLVITAGNGYYERIAVGRIFAHEWEREIRHDEYSYIRLA